MPILQATYDERVAFFFEDPRQDIRDHRKDGLCSILYLLRRELVETLGYEPRTDSEDDARRGGARHRLFASTILMFTTCDLLAKFLLDDPRRVGKRFEAFLEHSDGAALSPDDAKLLYALRNSLVHSFGFPTAPELEKLGLKNVGLAIGPASTVGASSSPPVARLEDLGLLYVNGTLEMTLAAIHRYRKALGRTDADVLRTKFDYAFATYGVIRFG